MEPRDEPQPLRDFLASARVKHVPKDQIIFYDGDCPTEVCIIKEGVVKLLAIDEAGNEKILHLLQAPNVIPLAFFTGPDAVCRWYYIALTDCELYVAQRTKLEGLTYSNRRMAQYFTNMFSGEVHEVLTRLDSLSKSEVDIKLIAALRYLVVCHAVKTRNGWWRVTFPVNHQLLAEMLGVSRESTSIAMKKLADKSIIRTTRVTQLEVDFEKLQTYRKRIVEGK